MPRTITSLELINKLMLLPPNTPIIGYSDETDYVNIADLQFDADDENAAVLEFTHDFDTRQW